MRNRYFACRGLFAFILLLFVIHSEVCAEIIYQTDFDSMTTGQTQSYPGAAGQDGWYQQAAAGDAYGEIQSSITHGGNALHEHTAISNTTGQQTIDQRNITAYDLSGIDGRLILSLDFYAQSSDYDAMNTYSANFTIHGGPHPGYEIIGLNLASGNGTAKDQAGVNIALIAFNGSDNNMAIPLTIGQQLAWDSWHSVTIILDHANDRYELVTVDGQTQDISSYQPPRSYYEGQWLRGQLIETIVAQVVPSDSFGAETDDDVYWDNVQLQTQKKLPNYVTVYESDFDDFTEGHTEDYPGAAGHNGWYKLGAVSPAYGEFQSAVADNGIALHEYTDITNNPGQQTIDKIDLSAFDLSQMDGVLAMSLDFYADSSDLSKTNTFTANFDARDSTHPGYSVATVSIWGGNGIAKSTTGVNIGISAFNGTDNNMGIPLTVGQNLTWNSWHRVILVVDHTGDRFESITVNGQTQDLRDYQPPRSYFEDQWLRGGHIDTLISEVVPWGSEGNRTNDDIYFDNIQIKTQRSLPKVIYQTDFDGMTLGQTQPYPGLMGQDDWYQLGAAGEAYGQMQDSIANVGSALHEHTAISNPSGQQTIDLRDLETCDLSGTDKRLKISLDFYAHSSDYEAMNGYSASFIVQGGPHPGFEIIGLYLDSGNGTVKSQAGVNFTLAGFNGSDNNMALPLTVGQQLAWDTWHSAIVVLDHNLDHFETVTIDGQTQDISSYQPPRSYYEGQWLRGQLIESLVAQIVPSDSYGAETDDDVYWDNLSIVLSSGDDETPLLSNPTGLEAEIIEQTVQLTWNAISDDFGIFDHYAVYRADSPFDYVYGKTPIGTVETILTANYLDTAVYYGNSYYYGVTAVATDGTEDMRVAQCIGPVAPRSENDLHLVTITRTPFYPRYAPLYTEDIVTEPGGFSYWCSRATGLDGQDENTKHWPDLNETMTYTATIRNRGTTTFDGVLQGTWRIDDTIHSQPTQTVTLAPGDTTEFTLGIAWDNDPHDICFTIDYADDIAENNTLTSNTLAVGFMTYIDQSYYDRFRDAWSPQWSLGTTNDVIDWLNRHIKRMNEMFAAAGSLKRVHYDVLDILEDGAATPSTPEQINFAVFPLRYYANDMVDLRGGYYSEEDDISYALIHEMAHQLGMIDIYHLSIPAASNPINSRDYQPVSGIMASANENKFSEFHALAMNHWLRQAHGYYGQFMYCLPETMNLKLVDFMGNPLPGATVKMYQYLYLPDFSKVISSEIKAQGTTDQDGIWTLPNVAVDPLIVPQIATGDLLQPNPFGYIHVVGQNTVLLFRVEYNGGVDFCWLDVPQANVAYWNGQTDTAVFEKKVALGGPVLKTMPMDLAEENGDQWHLWNVHPELSTYSIQTDAVHVLSGNSAVKMTADSNEPAFGMTMRYPADYTADWDLTRAGNLYISFYPETSGVMFNNCSPIIRLQDADGNYYQYQYWIVGHGFANVLDGTLNQWQNCVIPLNAPTPETIQENGWARVASGMPDMSNIECLEISVWMNQTPQYSVWIDDIYFDWPLNKYLDMDSDGLVDLSDVIIFAENWLEMDTTFAECEGADINMDRNVTLEDFMWLAKTYLMSQD
jgi:hypothetical protein